MATIPGTIPELKEQYENLDRQVEVRAEAAIDAGCLLVFAYEYPEQETEISIDTDEFTAVCPWTGLPDYGTLYLTYVPGPSCIELKSLKYYLLSFREVGIVQEHAANRILKDLTACCQPRRMKVTLDYKIRGGIHTSVSVAYPPVAPDSGPEKAGPERVGLERTAPERVGPEKAGRGQGTA